VKKSAQNTEYYYPFPSAEDCVPSIHNIYYVSRGTQYGTSCAPGAVGNVIFTIGSFVFEKVKKNLPCGRVKDALPDVSLLNSIMPGSRAANVRFGGVRYSYNYECRNKNSPQYSHTHQNVVIIIQHLNCTKYAIYNLSGNTPRRVCGNS
jgi:hypothetical protein